MTVSIFHPVQVNSDKLRCQGITGVPSVHAQYPMVTVAQFGAEDNAAFVSAAILPVSQLDFHSA